MLNPITCLAYAITLLAMTACTRQDVSPHTANQVLLADVQPEQVNVPVVQTDQPAESDGDEPSTTRKVKFIKAFVDRLKQGMPVAGLIVPVLDFAYYETDRCGGSKRILIPDLEAAKIDTPLKLGKLYSVKTADCETIPDAHEELIFNLRLKVSDWDRFDAAADDHNYETFYVTGKTTTDHMMIYIEKRDNRYAVYRLEYHIQTDSE